MATGLTQRALHGRVIHPTGKGIAFFLQLVKVGFHLRDTEGDFFGADSGIKFVIPEQRHLGVDMNSSLPDYIDELKRLLAERRR